MAHRSVFAGLVTALLCAVAQPARATSFDVLVASELTHSVRRYDGETGTPRDDFVAPGAGGLTAPRAMTFGSDGLLYVAGGGDTAPSVWRFDDKTGAVVDVVTSSFPSRIEGIAFGSDGNLYVAVPAADSVYEVDPTTGSQVGTLGAGSPLDGPRGLLFGPDGNLYVASFGSGQVLRFDGTNGAYLGVFASVPPGGAPTGMAFGPDGNLYVLVWYCGPASCLASDVVRFDGTTGAPLGSFLAEEDLHPVEPVGLLFTLDGKLLVSSHRSDELLRYDAATGAFVDSFAMGGGLDGPAGLVQVATALPVPGDLLVASRGNARVIFFDGQSGAAGGDFVSAGSGGLETPTQLLYGPDGRLYVANGVKPDGTPPLATSVLRYDGASGEFVDIFSDGFPGAVTQIVFGPDGALYGTLGPANRVFRANATTGAWTIFAGADSPLNFAAGLAFGPGGTLYVGSFQDGKVLRFDGATGAYLGVFGTVPLAGAEARVGGLAFGPDGNLYVTLASEGNDIWRFDGTTGASLGAFIPPADPHPDGPMFLMFAGDFLYVSARDTAEVMRYDATTGAFVDHFASGGGLVNATGIALVPVPQFDLIVASHDTDSVKRFSASGEYLGEFIPAGPDGQVHARSLRVGPDGRVYLSGGGDNSLNNTLKRYDPLSGAYLDTLVCCLPRISGLRFAPDGNFYFTLFTESVAIHADGSDGHVIREIGAGSPLNGPVGTDVGADGRLYVSSWGTHQVLRFDRSTGAYLDVFASLPSGVTAGIEFGPDGDLYVGGCIRLTSTCVGANVWRFEGATGTMLGPFIPPADLKPITPYTLTFGPDGNLYVSDGDGDRVLRYSGKTGHFIDVAAAGGGLNDPLGLAFLPEPGASAQMAAGLFALVALARRRRRHP
jgi:MYXO-CTERM domain-containing protein